jgi:hypothetical protein
MDGKLFTSVLLWTLIGFLVSTGVAAVNGYPPCAIYGICTVDAIEEYKRLRREADGLRDEINAINDESTATINELRARLDRHVMINEKLTDGIKMIRDISLKGVSNDAKIREIGKAITDIGNSLTNNSGG